MKKKQYTELQAFADDLLSQPMAVFNLNILCMLYATIFYTVINSKIRSEFYFILILYFIFSWKNKSLICVMTSVYVTISI